MAAERAGVDVLIGKGGSGSCAYWGSALSPTCMSQFRVLEIGKCQWLPEANWRNWDFSMVSTYHQLTGTIGILAHPCSSSGVIAHGSSTGLLGSSR